MQTIHLCEQNVRTGILRIPPGAITCAARMRPSVINIMPRLDSGREPVIRFIQAGYRQCYGARIHVDYPNLISVRDVGGRLIAAAGFRFAGEGGLFLEHYTERPVDEYLRVDRDRIAEVGNLVSRGGASIYLFAALVSHLDAVGVTHVAITSTESLARRLASLGARPMCLCSADPARVAHLGGDWGSYYSSRPEVLAGEIAPFLRGSGKMLGAAFIACPPRLLPRLHFGSNR